MKFSFKLLSCLVTGRGMTRGRAIQGLKHLLRRSRSEEGQSLVEFAITAMVFIVLVFAVFDFAHLFFAEMSAQNAIQEAARYGSTGNHLPDPKNPGNYLSRVTSIINTLNSDAIGVQFSNIQISSVNLGGVSTSNNGGGPGDYLTVTATVSIPLFTPLVAQMFPNGYTYTPSITVKNEPFPASQTK